MQAAASFTTAEILLRQEGEAATTGFLFSGDANHTFRYVAATDIDADAVDGRQHIRLDTLTRRVYVKLYDLTPAGHFVSTDFCRSWQLLPNGR